MKLLNLLILVLICSLSLIATSSTLLDTKTTIVVIDGKALLVDINETGNIVTTYMEVPGYFENNKDHKTKVLEATATYKRLSKEQMDQIRFIAIADQGWDLDEFMISNLEDLANHYHSTYANQIQITAAKHQANIDLIENNLDRIKELLISYGVSVHDINVKYKLDMGDEPTQFIKVVSNLKALSIR